MSVRVMAQVWELDLPPNEKFVLLAFADFSDDEGRCYPSIRRISWKTCLSPRQIKRIVRALRNHKVLEKMRGHRVDFPVVYCVIPSRGVKLPPLETTGGDILSLPMFDEVSDSHQVTPKVRGGVTGVPAEVSPVTPKPSVNHQEPSLIRAPAAREPDFVWEAVLEVCGLTDAEPTDSERGAWNKAVKELKGVKATPAEIRARAGNYRKRWKGIELTPMALAKNWNQCVAQVGT